MSRTFILKRLSGRIARRCERCGKEFQIGDVVVTTAGDRHFCVSCWDLMHFDDRKRREAEGK